MPISYDAAIDAYAAFCNEHGLQFVQPSESLSRHDDERGGYLLANSYDTLVFVSDAGEVIDTDLDPPQRTLIIDPTTRTITEHTYDGNWRSIAPLLNADSFDAVSVAAGELFVDAEGLFAPTRAFFALDNNTMFAGRGLLFGPLDGDRTTHCKLTVDELMERVRWLDASEAESFGRELDRRNYEWLSKIPTMSSL